MRSQFENQLFSSCLIRSSLPFSREACAWSTELKLTEESTDETLRREQLASRQEPLREMECDSFA